MNLDANQPNGFRDLVNIDLKFFLRYYLEILYARESENLGWSMYTILISGELLFPSMPLMLAPLVPSDDSETAMKKINSVANTLMHFVYAVP